MQPLSGRVHHIWDACFNSEPHEDDEVVIAQYRDSSLLQGECKTIDDTGGRPLQQALAYFRKQKDMLKNPDDKVIEEESRFKVWVNQDELLLLLQEEAEQKTMEGWVKFDMFFGALVVINGLMLGFATDGLIDEETLAVRVVETIFFLVFMTEWGIRWYCCTTGLCGMLANPWTRFDLFTILVSVFDIVLATMKSEIGGADMVSVLRVIRLLRLVRLVRLVKLLQELWMLLSGLRNSIRILAWTLLMHILLCYIFGLFMFEVLKVTSNSRIKDERGRRHWGSVPLAMLSMAQVASFSDAHEELEEVNDAMGPWILAVVLVFILADALGVLNLIVGLLLTTTLKLADRNERFKATTKRFLQHRALRILRDALIVSCEGKLGQMTDSPIVTKDLLLEWLKDNTPLTQNGSRCSVYDTAASLAESGRRKSITDSLTQSLEMSGHLKSIESIRDLVLNDQPKSGLAHLFRQANITELEIQSVFNEMTSVHGSEVAIEVDEFIQGCVWVTGEVHPIEVMSLLTGLRSLYDRMMRTESLILSASHSLQDTSDRVLAILEKYHTEAGPTPLDDTHLCNGPDEKEADCLEALANTQKKMMMLSNKEATLARMAVDVAYEQERWAAFDKVFAYIIVVNAFVIGAEVVFAHDLVRDFNSPNWDGWSMFWCSVDQLFLAIYCVEFVLRGVLFYQMRVKSDYRTLFGFLPQILTNMMWPTQVEILCSFPLWMKDTKTLLWLDFLVIIVAMVDNFILRSITLKDSWTPMLRLMGLSRLLRLVRLLHLIKPLTVIAKGFVSNFRLIFWSMVVLVGLFYAGSIVVVMLIGKQMENTDEFIRLHWSNIPQAMLTLGEMTTWDDWSHRVQEVGKHAYWMYGFSVVFLSVAALGILNLITGVMVQAAFHIVHQQQHNSMGLQLNMTKLSMQDAISAVYRTIDERALQERHKIKDHITQMRETVRKDQVRLKAEETEALKVLTPRTTHSGNSHDTFDQESTIDVDEYVSSGDEKCFYDEANYCYITHVTWCSSTDVAVGFDVVSDGSQGPMRDATLSLLVWDGTRASPAIFLPDWNVTGRHACCQESSESSSDEVEKRVSHMESLFSTMSSENRRRSTSHMSRGDILFTDVPSNARLRFRFGGNFSTVPVFAERPSLLEGKLDMDVSAATPVDPDRIGVREIIYLLQDSKLMHTLAKVNLTPAQALIVFQTLNVMLLGSIKVTDYIDALLKMRRPTLGFDTAGAKSFMRRLVMEKADIARDAENCNMCFSEVVSMLRRVNIVENDVADGVDGSTGYCSVDGSSGNCSGDEHGNTERGFINQAELQLVADAERLNIKNGRLQTLIRQRKLLTLVSSPRIFGVYEDECSEFDDKLITSAKSGWD